MNIRKLTSTLVIVVLSASTLGNAEEVCINCKANKIEVKKSTNGNTFKVAKKLQAERVNSDDFISLDDNEAPSEEITILNTVEDRIDNSQILLACDDTYKLVCDNIKKVCECV